MQNGVVVIPAQDPAFVDKVLEAIPPRVKASAAVLQKILKLASQLARPKRPDELASKVELSLDRL